MRLRTEAVKNWPDFADTTGVPGKQRDPITRSLRLDLGRERRSAR